MGSRIEEELELLRTRWADLEHREQGRWVLLPRYSLPETCVQEEADIAFQIKGGHPGNAPYAFYVRKPVALKNGGGFNKTTDANDPPFSGDWLKFSWRPESWHPAAKVREGSNLFNWALTFRDRLEQGA